ncbi:cytochrome oxidase assembly factor [Rhizoctonia solani]|uniref:Cytochrome oxidase assembly factor n=1 Tax=Rhizoctonia solani TaxID=456999 RepID=A0A8H8NRS9_9AGAM|nr:cytochrome oxidase assembly factor [Rhizoctonia solani]QRW18140.1 cytochrome oxidase assembly factor [Rhizoctonia solani]
MLRKASAALQDTRRAVGWLEVLVPRLTPVLCATTQMFFIRRCWRIFEKRWIPMIPFGALWIAAFVPGVCLGAYAYPLVSIATNELVKVSFEYIQGGGQTPILTLPVQIQLKVHFSKEYSNVFLIVWAVMWTSAAPPLILMAIAIIDEYMVKGSSNPAFIITVEITGKFFLLSVMINLCGRNLVQERFNLVMSPRRPRSYPPRDHDGAAANVISVTIQQEKFTEYELNEWPFAPKSPGTNLNHKRTESRSSVETKTPDSELTRNVHNEYTKRPLQHPRFFSRTQVKCAPPNRPNPRDVYKARNRTLLMYTTATVITAVGATYAAVPLYRAFCSATGFGGIPMTDRDSSRYSADRLVPREEAKRIKVHFNADTATACPGSSSLNSAKNTSKDDIIGIATYNVTPAKVAPYFAKVECFCFEEQKLIAGEEVDMPLLFFIDRDIVDDPLMADVDDVVLSYTFFRARRNSAGHLEPDAPQQVVLESQGWGDIPHAPPKPADSTAT